MFWLDGEVARGCELGQWCLFGVLIVVKLSSSIIAVMVVVGGETEEWYCCEIEQLNNIGDDGGGR